MMCGLSGGIRECSNFCNHNFMETIFNICDLSERFITGFVTHPELT